MTSQSLQDILDVVVELLKLSRVLDLVSFLDVLDHSVVALGTLGALDADNLLSIVLVVEAKVVASCRQSRGWLTNAFQSQCFEEKQVKPSFTYYQPQLKYFRVNNGQKEG